MLPAGVPNEMYKEPPSDYVQSGFPVEQKGIDALIEKYKVLTADLEQPEFVALCDQIYLSLGSPTITGSTIWDVFELLVKTFEDANKRVISFDGILE